MPRGPMSEPGLEIVRCVRCPQLRGDYIEVPNCMKCAFFKAVAGRMVHCLYTFKTIGEEYAVRKEQISRW